MIVVDTNVLAYLYLAGEHTARTEALLERDPDWAAPPLWRSELRNVLAGYLRRQVLSFEEVCRVQQAAEALLSRHHFQVDSSEVLALVRDSECSAYDCEFVALALDLGTKLVTMDKKLLAAFPATAVALTAV